MDDSRVVGAVDLDACADSARHQLLSTVLYGAALGRLAGHVFRVVMQWVLCGRCLTFPSFVIVVQSRAGAAWGRLIQWGAGAVDLDACADAA